MANSNGLASTLAAMDRAGKAPRVVIRPILVKAGHELADTMATFAQSSRDTGALINSIEVTAPGESTPAYSQPGGSRIAGPEEVIVTAGNERVRYAHLVEYGTAKAAAHPYFWISFRMRQAFLKASIERGIKAAIRKAWKNT